MSPAALRRVVVIGAGFGGCRDASTFERSV
jgi:hypothetical protein